MNQYKADIRESFFDLRCGPPKRWLRWLNAGPSDITQVFAYLLEPPGGALAQSVI